MPAPKHSITIEKPALTASVELTVVPQFPPSDPRSSLVSPEGRPGKYLFRAVLGEPGRGEVLHAIDFEELLPLGDSPIVVPAKATELRVDIAGDSTVVGIHFSINEQGRLGSARIELNAKSFDDAYTAGYDLLSPVLSRWAFDLDVAVAIVAVEVREVATGSVLVSARLAGQYRGFDPKSPVHSTPETRALLATYREANGATGPIVAALYYYKVVEGVRHLRNRRINAARSAGEVPKEPGERFPGNLKDIGVQSWDADLFTPYLTKKFNAVTDELRETVRNAAAHLEPGSSSLLGDRRSDILLATRAVPVLRYMARVMLSEELQRK